MIFSYICDICVTQKIEQNYSKNLDHQKEMYET